MFLWMPCKWKHIFYAYIILIFSFLSITIVYKRFLRISAFFFCKYSHFINSVKDFCGYPHFS